MKYPSYEDFETKEMKEDTLHKNIIARFSIHGLNKPVTIVGLHLKSRPTDESRKSYREGQAKVVATIINEAYKRGDSVIAMGDMNDFSKNPLDKMGSTPITTALEIMESAGPGLKNIGHLIPKEKRHTYYYWWAKRYQVIDHILMSPDLYKLVGKAEIPHDLYDNQARPHVSDHYPVLATINIPELTFFQKLRYYIGDKIVALWNTLKKLILFPFKAFKSIRPFRAN